ncbi:helix-turn-helix domain-containing protein [Corynebacterium afermentans]|uniref:helix-turn-helix domain-containing protein n=1 Tax=Corynebacterium afermentans TaxID=38286 RepID=UPI00336A4832
MSYADNNSKEIDFGSHLKDPGFAGAFEDASARSTLVETLRQLRKASVQTQRQVADAMGTTQSAISDLERGESDPQLSTVQRYARAVGAKIRFTVDSPDYATSPDSP